MFAHDMVELWYFHRTFLLVQSWMIRKIHSNHGRYSKYIPIIDDTQNIFMDNTHPILDNIHLILYNILKNFRFSREGSSYYQSGGGARQLGISET